MLHREAYLALSGRVYAGICQWCSFMRAMMSYSSYTQSLPSLSLRPSFRAKATRGRPFPPPISLKCPAQ